MGGYYASIAKSLERIADALEKMTAPSVDGKQHLVPASGLEAYIKARTGPEEPYQRHFTSTRPRRKIPEPQPLKA